MCSDTSKASKHSTCIQSNLTFGFKCSCRCVDAHAHARVCGYIAHTPKHAHTHTHIKPNRHTSCARARARARTHTHTHRRQMNSGDTSSDAGTGHSAGRPCAGTTSSQYLDFVTFLSRHYTCPHTRDLATEATRFHYIPPHASNTNRAGVVACLQTLHDARSERGRAHTHACLLYTSPSPRDQRGSRMPSSA